MNKFLVSKKDARIIVLQRIELAGPILKNIRKIFGRYLFTNFFLKFFLNSSKIGKKYFDIMNYEYQSISEKINQSDNNVLSIGAGIGGLELIINKNFSNKKYYLIERNYISKKVRYGWGGLENTEAYNNLTLQKKFLINNGINENQINIFDYDKDSFPIIKFDLIISLLSLDYHYDFDIYKEYLKKVSNEETKIIFDTIRSDYFKNVFKSVEVLRTDQTTIHKSKRIICKGFI